MRKFGWWTVWAMAMATAVAAASGSEGKSDGVVQFDAKAVKSAFAKGAPLVETGEYKIHASRREAPGMAEVHAVDTDVIYVLEGEATLVTGGTVVGSSETAPEETRGTSIDGGTEHRLAAGDVIVVPHGVPHWFRSVRGPLLYYVVKVR